jgi:hypothetical protein
MQDFVTLILKILAISAVITLLFFVMFLYFSSIDEAHESGNHYGFSIGATKDSVFSSLRISHGNLSKATYRVELYQEGKKKPVQIESSFDPSEQEIFDKNDTWKVFFDSSYFFDSLTLKFCEDRLCQIKRKRQFLEIP